MKRTSFLSCFVILALINLSACSSLGLLFGTSSVTDAQIQQLNQLSQWSVRGKVGYQFNNEAGSAYLNWAQTDNNYFVTLSGPFSLGAFEIKGNQDAAVFTQNKKQYFTSEPELLFKDMIGWPLPIQELPYWAKGIPAPVTDTEGAPPKASYDSQGLLQNLEQDNWHIHYAQYQVVNELFLPKKIIAKKDSLKLVLLFTHWELDE